MARKNLLSGLADTEASTESAIAYPVRGASKSMIRSVGELARQADAYLEGEQIVDLDPNLIESSFVGDRLGDDGGQYEELRDAIASAGQASPILVRPHPDVAGRYMVVFGHRRLRAARELGRKIRAIVKALDDQAHVLAQGQENAARANLSFVEKALFAKRLADLSYSRDVICQALASNDAAISKMISVATRIPERVLMWVGPAPGIGRERWVELSLLIGRNLEEVSKLTEAVGDVPVSSDERFELIFNALNVRGKKVRKSQLNPRTATDIWRPEDRTVAVSAKPAARKFVLELTDKDAKPFGSWIAANLDDLFAAYKKATKE